ncbi:hypothetical protein LTR70_010405 [Exophiala xenobiotica]|uniref:Aminotransferase-like plant mobile domain-containing protein n=1 Tax=Lithohypha guttulata TaxID=1690604 RepID=A0ABR0JU81_9EURO|nr:hypothetical protein LTR24_010360 [Lithohypha guttulata]KAK5309310.1 hypothetical protein LTR70_010405 [Exophiala xenobiotica]
MPLCAKSSDHTTCLEKLFSTIVHPPGVAEGTLDDDSELRSAHFFREVIYTYAIFFAQSKHSRGQFQSHQKKNRSKLPEQNQDPLLEKLYSNEWSTAFVDDLGIGEVKPSYRPETDFPFFAQRLDILQEYSLAQTPNSWRLLWKDRRDLNRFYTLWAALAFEILTLSMGLIQILLGIAQVAAVFLSSGGS